MSLTDNLQAVWELDDTAWTDAFAGIVLTNNNSVTSVAGKIGNARNFVRASSQSLSIADNAALSMPATNFTIACWVNKAALTQLAYILSKATTTTSINCEYLLGVSVLNQVIFRVCDNNTVTLLTASNFGSLSASTWYWIVAEHQDGVQMALTINNGTAQTATRTTGCWDGANSFIIGNLGGVGTNYWGGQIDQVAIWKRLLTGAEKTQLYNSGNGLAYASWLGTTGGLPFDMIRMTGGMRESIGGLTG